MPIRTDLVYSKPSGNVYLAIVNYRRDYLEVQRFNADKVLNNFWAIWLRYRLLESVDPKWGLAVEVGRRGNLLTVRSNLGDASLTAVIQGIAAEIVPLRRAPIRRRNDQSHAYRQRWSFAPDHGITPEVMASTVRLLNEELPAGVRVYGEASVDYRLCDLELDARRTRYTVSLSPGLLARWVEWRFAEALAVSRV